MDSRRVAAWVGWSLMTLFALVIAVGASRYLFGSPENFFEQQRETYVANLGTLRMHVGAAIVALVLGPWQFWSRLRVRHLRLHRAIGGVYLAAVALGGVAGLLLAPLAHGGFPARIGFTWLAVLWLGCSGFALRAILQRRIQDHRDWMIRSYALTFAAVTLRLWLPLMTEASGVEFTEAYVTVSWLAWVPNLLIAEIAIQRRHALPRGRVANAAQGSQP